MDEYIEKHLIDVLNATIEVESYFADTPKLFHNFQKDMLRQRAVERNVEIMGEAINRILKVDPTFELPNAKAIINTRNRVIFVTYGILYNAVGTAKIRNKSIASILLLTA